MGKRIQGLDALRGLNIETGEIDVEKRDRMNRERDQKEKQRNRNKGYRPQNNDKYVGAPYNFVPFSDKVYTKDEKDLKPHNVLGKELFSGELSYQIEAKTPIFVGDGSENFYRDAYNRIAIPGSTMRGLIRTNIQTLGFSAFGDDIDDYALMYRSVGASRDDPNKGFYNDILGSKTIPYKGKSQSILENVKAGYIAKEGGKYYIYQTKLEKISNALGAMNYYVLNERYFIEDHLKGKKTGVEFLLKNGRTQNDPKCHFRREERGRRTQYIGRPNNDYKPYYEPISYELDGERKVSAVDVPGKLKNEGYIVGTGKMQQKKALYIVPEREPEKRIQIPEKDIRAFEIDFEKKKNTIKAYQKYFGLPEQGECKPVFYIELGDKLYFGFTPRLRLFYDYTIKDGLPAAQKQGGLDLAKTLLGFADNGGYKSKVSFSDALLVGNVQTKRVKAVLGEPKASSYNDYLKTDSEGNAMTYQKEGFRLRGQKQYWLWDNPVDNRGNGNESVMTEFHPLDAGSRFQGKVRFHNLTEEELGLLLWAIRLEKNSHMNVGKGKPLGYGNIIVKLTNAKRFDLAKAYNLFALELEPWSEDLDADALIEKFKGTLADALGVKDVMKEPSIKTFFAMKDDTKKPDPKKIRYMDINAREYQNRRPLGDVNQVLRD